MGLYSGKVKVINHCTIWMAQPTMHAKHAIGYRSLGTYSYQNLKNILKIKFQGNFVYAANTTLHIHYPLV